MPRFALAAFAAFALAAAAQAGTLDDVKQRGSIRLGYSGTSPKKIAVAENTSTLGAVDRALARRSLKAEIVKTKTVAEGFDLPKAGKVDALAGDRTVLVGTFHGAGGAQGLTAIYNAWLQLLGKPTLPLLTMFLLNALPD